MEIPSNEFRIKNRAVQETRDAGKKPAVAKTDAPPSAAPGSEQIALSSKALLIQKAHEVVSNSADIRAEKVNAIKEKVQNREYHVSSDVLADADRRAGPLLELLTYLQHLVENDWAVYVGDNPSATDHFFKMVDPEQPAIEGHDLVAGRVERPKS